MSAGHARLLASSAHRWLVCAGSVNASAGRDTRSAPAAQGTFAHDIAAKCLAAGSDPAEWLLKKTTIDGFEVVCDQEMVDAIDLYVDTLLPELQADDKFWIEMSLLDALQKIDPDMGGTADFVRYRPAARHLRVCDFKYGQGVFVEVEGNPQLKKYAVGAMLEVNQPVDEVEVLIVQPRFEGAQPVRSFTFKAIELLDFIADLKEAAERTRQPDAPLVAGEHCKFCPASRDCPELERRSHALVAAQFDVASPYDAKKLAEALAQIPLVKERIKAIEEFAYQEAMRGADVPGYKLVEKRPTRKWKSEDVVRMWCEQQAISPYAEPEILSPAQLEKRLGENAPRGKKKEAGKVLKPLIEKVSSGYALVPESDDRPPAKRIEASAFDLLPAP